MVSATTLPIGLLIYGWTANARLFWLLPGENLKIFQGDHCWFIMTWKTWVCSSILSALVSLYAWCLLIFERILFVQAAIGPAFRRTSWVETVICPNVCTKYTSQVDNYALYAASAIAGVASFRAIAGFGFPLFADQMYKQLGDGNSLTILDHLIHSLTLFRMGKLDTGPYLPGNRMPLTLFLLPLWAEVTWME
jgi:hypothetical protein